MMGGARRAVDADHATVHPRPAVQPLLAPSLDPTRTPNPPAHLPRSTR